MNHQEYVELCKKLGITSQVKLCECGCGQPAPIATTSNIRQGAVRGFPQRFVHGHHSRVKNNFRCTHPELSALKHGCYVGGESPEVRAYYHAKERCQNPQCRAYKNYGARGIKFLFESFEQFLAEIGPRPSGLDARGKPLYSLDRIDNDGHYAPGNVRWATKEVQLANRRNTRTLPCPPLPFSEYAAETRQG